MPVGIQPPIILNYNAATVPILQLALSGQGLSEQSLFDVGMNTVRTPLITVPGAVVPLPYLSNTLAPCSSAGQFPGLRLAGRAKYQRVALEGRRPRNHCWLSLLRQRPTSQAVKQLPGRSRQHSARGQCGTPAPTTEFPSQLHQAGAPLQRCCH